MDRKGQTTNCNRLPLAGTVSVQAEGSQRAAGGSWSVGIPARER